MESITDIVVSALLIARLKRESYLEQTELYSLGEQRNYKFMKNNFYITWMTLKEIPKPSSIFLPPSRTWNKGSNDIIGNFIQK